MNFKCTKTTTLYEIYSGDIKYCVIESGDIRNLEIESRRGITGYWIHHEGYYFNVNDHTFHRNFRELNKIENLGVKFNI